ncbi:hypothetical protein [Schlesneria sp. DSM 10557]|uniref:hypothetical protein n=1 Tax=Schlesneria sp. DSM 10557 TaxID=3044399 RepID=UPI00359FF6CB
MLMLCALLLASSPIDVAGAKQLFLDRRFIAESERVTLQTNPAQKVGMILDGEGKPIQGHISRVIDDQGTVKLYLGADSVDIYESADGLHFKAAGSRLSGGHFTTIFLDEHTPDATQRYKLFHLEFSPPFDPQKHGVFASYSDDGIHFTKAGRVLPFFTDNPTIVQWDPQIGRYVIYTRAFDYSSENQRRIGRIELDDPLQPWPYKKSANDRMFLGIDNVDVVLSADDEDDPHSDIYYNAAMIYPWAADTHLMFTSQFRHFSPQRNPFIRPRVPGQWEDFGMLEVQLAVSRDGRTWSRPTRDAYFPTGLPDEWDRWYSVMAPGIIRRGNYLYQYYYSSGQLHDSVALRPEYEETAKQKGGVGIVRQRLDGFVSADCDHKGGSLRTPVLVFRGNTLRLNIDTGAMGTAFVELQDEQGVPIPGFTLAECEEIGGNFIDQRVYWRGSPDVSSLATKPIRMKVVMKRAKFYSFQFTDG